MAEEEKKTKKKKESNSKVEASVEKKEKTGEVTKKEGEVINQNSTPAIQKEVKVEKKDEVPSLEREYIIPIKRYILTVPRYRRAKKAVSIVRKFIVRHMAIRDGDLRKVKIDKYLNNELWYRGIKKPANKIKVKAKKIGDIVTVELAEIPKAVQFAKKRDENLTMKMPASKVKMPKHDKKQDHIEEKEKVKTKEQKTDVVEKEKASVEAGLERQEKEAKKTKHSSKGEHKEKTSPRRMSLKK